MGVIRVEILFLYGKGRTLALKFLYYVSFVCVCVSLNEISMLIDHCEFIFESMISVNYLLFEKKLEVAGSGK